jgi:hypothetical protein
MPADAALDKDGIAGVGGDTCGSPCALVTAEREEPDRAAMLPADNTLWFAAELISPFQECQPAPAVEARVEALVLTPTARLDCRGRQFRRPAGIDNEQRVDRCRWGDGDR